ncbi:MAG: type II secretion system protein GspN [Oligoflexales bacterium]
MSPEVIIDKKKKFALSLIYVFLFFSSFTFFVYYTFPYNVLKEAITSIVADATGIQLRIQELGPSFPLGLEATNVKVVPSSANAKPIEFREVEVGIGVLNLLIGRLAIDVGLMSQNKGYANISSRHGILDLALNQVVMPKKVELEASRFDVGNLITFFLTEQGNSPDANPMLGPLLAQIGMKANLEGYVHLDLDADDISHSQGDVSLKLNDALLLLSQSSLGLGDQKFKKALIKAKMDNGKLNFSKESGFQTQELTIDLNGDVALNKLIEKSTLNMSINLKMEQALKDQMGFILEVVGGKDGQAQFKINGTLANPSPVTM